MSVDPHDVETIADQIGREPRALEAVAVRCPFGHPAVTRQAPTDADGHPFPTSNYLTCPHLVRRVDRIEAGGGVAQLEELVRRDEGLAADLIAAHARHAARSDAGHLIGGVADATRLKCLHAHAAFALDDGNHRVGELVLANAAPAWCSDNRCSGRSVRPGRED